MANALVVRRSQLPKSQTACRAAQYVRMSTDYQRYSIENQATVIAAYAQVHALTIVRTYRDQGESGLKLKNRAGLTQLLDDVRSGHADFDHILVYDVSRWGRFQDIDESAHYEFICKQAGIRIAYCAEQFDNDGTMLSSILKNLKRVMAAEYSRELSAKVHAGASRFAGLGFKLGGQVGYGLRRVLVDEKQQPRAVLANGDRKYLLTDHVRLRPGTPDEVATVKWIFEQFLQRRSETALARELNRRGTVRNGGRPWTRAVIGRILRNENYIGNLIYNRRSRKLRENYTNNPPNLWIRSEGCLEPIVEHGVFWRARKIIEQRRVNISDGEMLARLRKILMKEGRLSPAIINRTVGLPCTATYRLHFGSLRNVYRLIGYTSQRDCDYIESRQRWANQIAKFASQLTAMMIKARQQATFDSSTECLVINETINISFRIARWRAGARETHAPHWSIQRRARLPAGWIIAIRLGENNTTILDYLLLPANVNGRLLRFREGARARHNIDRFESSDAVARSLIRRLTTRPHASSTMSDRSRTPRAKGRAKKWIGRGPH